MFPIFDQAACSVSQFATYKPPFELSLMVIDIFPSEADRLLSVRIKEPGFILFP